MRTKRFKGALLVCLVMVSLMALSAILVVAEELFFDNFDDGVADGWTPQLGTWEVIDGEYFTSIGTLTGMSNSIGSSSSDKSYSISIYELNENKKGINFSLELLDWYDKVFVVNKTSIRKQEIIPIVILFVLFLPKILYL